MTVAALGDAAVIVLFAALGRAAHGEGGNPLVHTVLVAAPFLVGWFIAAPLLGAYGAPVLFSLRAAVPRTILSWLAGGVIGLALRSIGEGRLVPLTFVAVALGFVLVLLVLWRLILIVASSWLILSGRESLRGGKACPPTDG